MSSTITLLNLLEIFLSKLDKLLIIIKVQIRVQVVDHQALNLEVAALAQDSLHQVDEICKEQARVAVSNKVEITVVKVKVKVNLVLNHNQIQVLITKVLNLNKEMAQVQFKSALFQIFQNTISQQIKLLFRLSCL